MADSAPDTEKCTITNTTFGSVAVRSQERSMTTETCVSPSFDSGGCERKTSSESTELCEEDPLDDSIGENNVTVVENHDGSKVPPDKPPSL